MYLEREPGRGSESPGSVGQQTNVLVEHAIPKEIGHAHERRLRASAGVLGHVQHGETTGLSLPRFVHVPIGYLACESVRQPPLDLLFF